MEKLDLTKKYKSYFSAKTKPELVEIETAQYLSIVGEGDPNGEPFVKKLQALYPVAYSIKFAWKAKGKDFVVSKLEGLWWFDEEKYAHATIDSAPVEIPRSEWKYRLLIRMPEFVSAKDIDDAKEAVISKKNITLASEVVYFSMTEGKCVQMLHMGPFSKEPETLKAIGAFSDQHKLQRNGLHHEIYLSDFRKTPPEKLKTILREPVR